jgi:hypothetical protein
MGSFNICIDLDFSDGATWLARFRLLNFTRPSVEKTNFDRMSEVAVYRLLAQTSIPAPVIYHFALDGDENNSVGLGYILMEKLPGQPMDWLKASTTQKNHVFRQMTDIYFEIEKVPQMQIGRPVLSPHKSRMVTEVGACYFDYGQQGECIPHGPFSSSTEWYMSCLLHRRDLIMRGEVGTSARDDAFCVNQYLFNSISAVVDPAHATRPFLLKHVDSRDCNFLVDANYTISGVIDWELAYFAPKDSAFQSPLFMVDVLALHNGCDSRPSGDEERFAREFETRNRPDVAKLVRQGGKSRVFELSMYTDPQYREDFEGRFGAVWCSVEGKESFSWGEWKGVRSENRCIVI